MALTLGLRPRLRFSSERTPEECRDLLLRVATEYAVSAFPRYLIVQIPESQQHYWSPHLQLTLDPDEKGQTLIRGLITPRPTVWTLFAGFYGVILVLGFFASVYGLAQWQLNHPTAWVWSPVISACLLAVVYGAARVGQQLGRTQTEELLKFLQGCLTEP